MTRRRVLVTGSRDWTDRDTLAQALLAEYREYGPLTVVDGKCPTGADRLAHEWCVEARARGCDVIWERYPADWERTCDKHCRHQPRTKNGRPYCPVAGHLRNQKMVDLGAHVCLAFPLAGSKGTVDCMRRARNASIPVHDYGVM